jgi:hypothetical protein
MRGTNTVVANELPFDNDDEEEIAGFFSTPVKRGSEHPCHDENINEGNPYRTESPLETNGIICEPNPAEASRTVEIDEPGSCCTKFNGSTKILAEDEGNRSFPSVPDTPDPPRDAKVAKKVSFSDLHIREYGIILGDHPCSVSGPPITVEWQPMEMYKIPVDDYEASLVDNSDGNESSTTTGTSATAVRRRRLNELRMPAEVRRSMLKLSEEYTDYHSEENVKQTISQCRKIRNQRRLTSALFECDFEPVEIMWQSLRRKMGRYWNKRNKDVPEDPAAVWLEQRAADIKLHKVKAEKADLTG